MSRIHNVMLSVFLVAGALPVHATIPGKNGRIAFAAGPDIYTMNPDGSAVRQLTNLGPDSSGFWTFVMNADGSGKKRIIEGAVTPNWGVRP